MKDFLTTQDVGERLGVGVAHVQRLVKQGQLPHVRNGRRIVIPRPAWEAFVASRSADALASLKEGIHAAARA